MLFPDKQGLIPTTQWKLTTKGERWWPGETLSAAIGQSFLINHADTNCTHDSKHFSGLFGQATIVRR